MRSDGRLEVRNGVTIIGLRKRPSSTKIVPSYHCSPPPPNCQPEAKSRKSPMLPTLSALGNTQRTVARTPLSPKQNPHPTTPTLTYNLEAKTTKLPTASNCMYRPRYTSPTPPMTSESSTEKSKLTSEKLFPPAVLYKRGVDLHNT